ncbi:MAG: trimethylamine methyltransferase family protein [Actinomycetota bacterium]
MTTPVRSGRRGRGARRDARTAFTQRFLPEMERGIPYLDALLPEQVEIVHDRTMRLLETTGIEFRDDESIELWRRAGAGGGVEIEGYRLRIDRAFLMELLSTAPSEYTMVARDPERSVTLGGRKSIFTPAYGAPFVRDLDGTRRNATLTDFDNFAKIAQMTPAMQMAGGVLCEPMDIAVPHRHLHMTYSLMKHSTKPFMGAVTSRERAEDSLEMTRMLFGKDFVDQNTVMTCLANGNSPLVWDSTMLDAVKVYSGANQAMLFSPFVLGGASTPASTIGSVVQINAEALAGVAFSQIVRPGAPAVYGQWLATVSMKSGAPMAGTPDIDHMNLLVGQLARRYKLPWRCSGMCTASKAFDAQAGYEAARNMFGVALAGANFVLSTTGYMESALCQSYAKAAIDGEQAELFRRFVEGINPGRTFEDELDAALEAMDEVEPGGHFLGTAHTLANFESAFAMPELMDSDGYEQWLAAGGEDTETRGNQKAKQLLAEYEEPALPDDIDEALRDYVARRVHEIPDTLE